MGKGTRVSSEVRWKNSAGIFPGRSPNSWSCMRSVLTNAKNRCENNFNSLKHGTHITCVIEIHQSSLINIFMRNGFAMEISHKCNMQQQQHVKILTWLTRGGRRFSTTFALFLVDMLWRRRCNLMKINEYMITYIITWIILIWIVTMI